MNVQPNDEARRVTSSSGSSGSNRGTPATMQGQSQKGQGRGTGTTATSSGAERGFAEHQQQHQHHYQDLQAMESMSLASPNARNAAAATAAASAADSVASWNESPAMLQRELMMARMRSVQARAREVEIQQRLQALADAPTVAASAAAAATGALSSPGYLHSAGPLVAAPTLYAGQLGMSAQGRIYPQSATASRIPFSQNFDQLRAAADATAREQAIMTGLGRDQPGAPILARMIPPPPLADDLLGLSSGRGQTTAASGAAAVDGQFGVRTAAGRYPMSSPSIHTSSLMAVAQERVELIRRMQQTHQQPLVSVGPVLSPIYGTTGATSFHSPAALLAVQQNQQLQQLAMQHQQRRVPAAASAAAALAAAPSMPWVQTNISVAEVSPTRSLRPIHAGLGGQGIGAMVRLDDAETRVTVSGAMMPEDEEEGREDRTAYQVRGTFIDEITELDVLCGRGGRSNHWPGNKRYRRVISEMKDTYKSSEGRKSKTGLSRAIVDHVLGYGGRFVREEEDSGRYYVLSKAEARVKTSQALREGKDLKWTR